MPENAKITTTKLRALLANPPESDVFDTEVRGFHVRHSSRGLTFRFLYRARLTGKQRVLTIGRWGAGLTADQARKQAIEAQAVVTSGGDPREALEAAKREAKRQEAQTVEAYLDGPYSVHQGRRKDGSATLQRIRRDFSDWLSRPMTSLGRADLVKWQADKETREMPPAFATMKRSYDALVGMFNHAVQHEVIPRNPLKGIKLQRPAQTEAEIELVGSERRYLDSEEVDALFRGLDAYQDEKREQRRNSRQHGKAYLPDLDGVAYVDHVKPWIMTIYYSGLRPGDIFGLRWEHLNLDFKTVRKVIEKTAHHNPEPTTLPLADELADMLREWHAQHGKPKRGMVFPSHRTGKRMDKTAMQKPWAHVRKLAGLPEELGLYTLRHNFASQLVMAGVDLLTVSRLMCHSDIQTTIRFYAHLAPDHARKALEAFSVRHRPKKNPGTVAGA